MEILLTEEQIQQRVSEMAAAISQTYADKEVHLVGLLDNAFIFVADLVRRLTCPVSCSLVYVDIRDVIENGHERRLISHYPSLDVHGQDILLVDCVLHTGVTQEHLIQQFLVKGAASIRTATLIDKSSERRVALEPEFVGFKVDGAVMVGYGMGAGRRYRNLPYIARMAPKTAEGSRQ